MRTLQKTAGILLILVGVVVGFAIVIYFISLGIDDLKQALYLRGLLRILIYGEFWGLIAALVLLTPGVLLLRFLPDLEEIKPLPEPTPLPPPE